MCSAVQCCHLPDACNVQLPCAFRGSNQQLGGQYHLPLLLKTVLRTHSIVGFFFAAMSLAQVTLHDTCCLLATVIPFFLLPTPHIVGCLPTPAPVYLFVLVGQYRCGAG